VQVEGVSADFVAMMPIGDARRSRLFLLAAATGVLSCVKALNDLATDLAARISGGVDVDIPFVRLEVLYLTVRQRHTTSNGANRVLPTGSTTPAFAPLPAGP